MIHEHITHVISHAAFERMQQKHAAFVARANAKSTAWEARRYEFRKGDRYIARATGETVMIEDIFDHDIHIKIVHSASAESMLNGIETVTTSHIVSKEYIYDAIQKGRLLTQKTEQRKKLYSSVQHVRNVYGNAYEDISAELNELSNALDSSCAYESVKPTEHKFTATSLEEIKESMLNENVQFTDYD